MAAAGTGVRLSDGSTQHPARGVGRGRASAWRLHAGLVRRSLERGVLPGLGHAPGPAADPLRWPTSPSTGRASRARPQRLSDYVGKHRLGVLDEPATARALARYL